MVGEVWDEPQLLRGSFDDAEERRQMHDTTKACACAMWTARSTSLATLWDMTVAVCVDGWELVVGELRDGRLPPWGRRLCDRPTGRLELKMNRARSRSR